MEKIAYTFGRLPWCELLVATGEAGLVAVQFVGKEGREREVERLAGHWRKSELIKSAKENRAALEELHVYAAGELREFSVPLDLRGTDFQLAAWRALLNIPYGETRTYADIARAVGHPRSFRAVGMANHSNPIALIVPCHRVIGSDRSLVGYGGGLDLKRMLLEHEHRNAPTREPARGSRSLPLWE
ncbi:MAG TPA: methylated-DNA--[protein]-cysteine S-methyltransferase [Terriglobia bacterium]|nr:methylated-DNA--[protein]-cysteine S-methyltransferase [Terriglobia bacterium]